MTNSKSKLRKVSCRLELDVSLVRFYTLIKKLRVSQKTSTKDFNKLIIFLQEKIKPLTSDSKILFECSKMIISKPTNAEIENKFSDLLNKITNMFYKMFFVVEGYNRNFILESVLSVNLIS